MTTSPYKPKKNSLLGKVCAYFSKNPSDELTPWDISQKWGVRLHGIKAALADAVGAGILVLAKNAEFDPCYGPGPNINKPAGNVSPVPAALVPAPSIHEVTAIIQNVSAPIAPFAPVAPITETSMTKISPASAPKAAPKSKPTKASAATEKHFAPLQPDAAPACQSDENSTVLVLPGLGEFVVRRGVVRPNTKSLKNWLPALLGIEIGDCIELPIKDRSSICKSITKAHADKKGRWTRSDRVNPGAFMVWRAA